MASLNVVYWTVHSTRVSVNSTVLWSVKLTFSAGVLLTGKRDNKSDRAVAPTDDRDRGVSLSKHFLNGITLHIWEQVTIATPHLFGSVANEVIDDSLINAFGCKVADEAVP